MQIECSHRHNHKLLKINGIFCMHSTVDDIHHWNRKNVCHHASKITIQRLFQCFCRGFGTRHGNAKNCICTKIPLIIRAILFHHDAVDSCLIEHIKANEFFPDLLVDVIHYFSDTQPKIPFLSIPKFDCLKTPGACARRNGLARRDLFSSCLCLGSHFHFDRRISPGI